MSGVITVPLGCPLCGNERLDTIERITGYASTSGITRLEADGGQEVDIAWAGDTDVDWNSSTTVGVRCGSCDWSWHGEDWADQLAVSATAATEGGGAEPTTTAHAQPAERCLAAAAAFVGLAAEADSAGRGHLEGLEIHLGAAGVEAWRQLVAAVAEVAW